MGISVFASEGRGDIKVKIINLKNSKGKVMIALCKNKKEFDDKEEPEMALVAEINNKQAEAVFENVKYGEYAIITFHDENNNDKIDFMLVFPKEGYGASNNKISMGPPNYKKSVFKHNSDLLEMDIDLVYFGKL